MRKIEIHGWGCPSPTIKNYTNYKDAGFTTVLYAPLDHGIKYGSEELINSLKLFDDIGLDYLLVAFNENGWSKFPMDGDSIDYLQFKGLKGIFVFDEPSIDEHVTYIASLINDFEKKNHGMEFRFNMSLGYQAAWVSQEEYPDSFQRVRLSCDWICKETLDKLACRKVFSTDYYPLRECGIQHDYLYPLEYAALMSKKYGYEFFNYIQSSGGWNDWDPAREVKSVEDLRFQILCSFAYGATGIGYFTYGTDPNFLYHGLVKQDGSTTEKYEFAKQVNAEIHAIEDVYLAYSWEKAGLLLSQEPAKYAQTTKIRLIADAGKFSCIKEIQHERDLLIGEFTNKESCFAHWIVNYIDPLENVTHTVYLTPEEGCEIKSIWKNGKEIKVDKIEGKYVFSMNNGEGVFVEWM